MTKFIVKGTVKYNGTTYSSGAVVEVENKDAKEFKKYGWQIKDEPKNNSKPKTEDKQPKTEDKTETATNKEQTEQKDVK